MLSDDELAALKLPCQDNACMYTQEQYETDPNTSCSMCLKRVAAKAQEEATCKEIGERLEGFTDFDGDSLRAILSREWAVAIQALKQGSMAGLRRGK